MGWTKTLGISEASLADAIPKILGHQTNQNTEQITTNLNHKNSGSTKKPSNQRAFHGIWGARSPKKEAHQPHVWFPKKIPQRNASKSFPQKSFEKALKSTKRRNAGRWRDTRWTTSNLLYIPWMVHTRSSKLPEHLTLSQDESWSSQASLWKI
jgi:hypothetical protein